jgi:RHS repeat-associated protein
MGMGWSNNLSAHISFAFANVNDNWPSRVRIDFGDGRYRNFIYSASGRWIPRGSHKDSFSANHPDGQLSINSEFIFKAVDSDDEYVFRIHPDTVGQKRLVPDFSLSLGALTEIRHSNGWRTSVELAASTNPTFLRPVRVRNAFGQSLVFSYTPNLQISQIQRLSAEGVLTGEVKYTYDPLHRLRSIQLPDGTVQDLHYEDARGEGWLTGYSLNGSRIDTYRYDSAGRAFETTRANGADRYASDYSTSTLNPSTGSYQSSVVVDPLNTRRTFAFSSNGNRIVAATVSAPPTDASLEPVRTRATNAHGFVTSETTFRGISENTTYEPNRQLPITITEGSGSRTQTFTWHPTFRLPTQIDETGGKRTTFAYDDKGNLLRKTITSTTGTPVNEVWTWTYNAQGLMATETDPLGARTSHTYNAWGQLTRTTNALGHITTYAYNPAGQIAQINEPTGLIRRMTYTPRGWLATSTLSAGGVNLATAYTYTVDGQIKSAALPNGHTITYFYDAALRNTGWSDNRGQSATYTLDPAGNATEEQVKNNGGQLALQIRRTISALNRVQSETLGAGVTETYTQDPNGRLASTTDALGKTTSFGRDALDRINRITDATSRAATLTYNAQDAVTQVVDFKFVTTTYARDVQGSARTEATPDAGTTATTTDALGLPSRIVDALGRASAITRDALGRPTLITHSPAAGTPATTTAGKTHTTELLYDQIGTVCNATNHANASKGRLCQVIDKVDGVTHATTQYQWDAFGRLTAQSQTLSSAIANHSNVQTTAFTYLASGGGRGELATLTYPSGSVLTHQYNAAGRLSGMVWNGQPLLQNITWNALGQPLAWTWAFADANTATSLNAARVYNTAGQLTSTEFASFTPDATGRIVSVTQKLMRPNGSGGWLEETVPFNALYNALGQLTSFQAVGASLVFQWGHTYSYDANANRTGGSITANGASMGFTNALSSNRLTTASGITVTSNAAGDITSLLGKTLAYDAAGRLSEATAVPPCPSGLNCAGQQTTLSRFNGWGQRYLRDTPSAQSVFSYGTDGYNLLSETTRNLSTSALSTTEHIWMPTASGPMPVAAVINGVHHAVHADHLNTPRRLSDANKAVKWQWPYSGFGEIAPQATSATGQGPVSYALRYPGQVDDGNGLFYNWHRFYDPRVGRYTKADPIGLDGGWNRFGYVDANPLGFVDPEGLRTMPSWWDDAWKPLTPPGHCATPECAAGLPNNPGDNRPQKEIDNSLCQTICTLVAPIDLLPNLSWKGAAKWLGQYAGATLSCKLYCDNKCPK